MPSITTQIIGPAAAPLAAQISGQNIRPTVPSATPEQIAIATQTRAKEETTRLEAKNDRPSVQVPKRVEPAYGPSQTKKLSKRNSEDSSEQTVQQEADSHLERPLHRIA